MKYVSTRGTAPILDFEDVVLAGLARDGGLYVPQSWPRIPPSDLRQLADLPYPDLAARILALFAQPLISEEDLRILCRDAYRGFDCEEIAPLKSLANGDRLLELTHGPTLAFKDYAMQVLGRLFDRVLRQRGRRATIVGATSGDTGSAAIEACRDREAIDVYILYPHGRVSEVQRRQMTTVKAPNVHALAIEGTFDDCQNLVKALFNDHRFRDRFQVTGVNSINWARIAAQVVYYAFAALKLGTPERPLRFAVPTGNFGNVFAGYAARRMGFAVGTLIVASNENDILTRFFASGRMETGRVIPTLSPSMDIQVSSNFERYLFELYDRNADVTAKRMDEFRISGCFAIDDAHLSIATTNFTGARFDDTETVATIASVYRDTGYLLDPHTAVGLSAAHRLPPSDDPLITIATAHPAKFPDAVERATGIRPSLPDHLADLMDRQEHLTVLPADLSAVQDAIARSQARQGMLT